MFEPLPSIQRMQLFRRRKKLDPFTDELLKAHAKASPEVSDAQIVERMLLPMLLECSRCLEDGIVASPTEVDIALVYGLGFPPFRGGIFRWADATGTKALLAAAEKHAALGALGRIQEILDLPTETQGDAALAAQFAHRGKTISRA